MEQRTDEMKEKGNTLMVMLVLFSLMLGMLLGCVGNGDALPANNIAITSTPSESAWLGIGYVYHMKANQTCTMYPVILPDWMTASLYTISGTPVAEGGWQVSLRVVSTTTGTTAWQNWTIWIAPSNWIPSVTSIARTYALVGQEYVYPLTFNSSAFIRYSSLPSWLSYNSLTQTLSGIPSVAATYPVSLLVYNSNDALATNPGYYNFSIIAAAAGSPIFTSIPPTNGSIGVAYTYTPTLSGTLPANVTIGISQYPYWITPKPVEIFNGTPTQAGVYQFSILAYEYVVSGSGVYQTTTLITYGWQNWSVVVGVQPFPVFNLIPRTTTITVGDHFSYTPTTDIATTITVIQSPDWLSYKNGIISGSPSVIGLYQVKVLAYSAAYGTYTLETFNIKVDPLVWPEMAIDNMWYGVIPVFILIVIGLFSAISPEGLSITVLMSSMAIGIGLLTWVSVLPQWTLLITAIIIVLLIFRAQDSEVISIGRN